MKGYNGNDYASTTEFLSVSKLYTDKILRECFEYRGRILNSGYPRNDILFCDNNTLKSRICKTYGINIDSIKVLFAPTFRGNFKNEEDVLDFGELKKAIEQKLNRSVVILYRAHPMIESSSKPKEFDYIVNCTSYPDMQELLAISDILITDYSSSMWDAIVSDNPKTVFLFAPDIDKYINERGFTIGIEEWPFQIARSNKELKSNIQNYCHEEYLSRVSEFKKSVGSYENGSASVQVVQYMLDNLDEKKEEENGSK